MTSTLARRIENRRRLIESLREGAEERERAAAALRARADQLEEEINELLDTQTSPATPGLHTPAPTRKATDV